MGSRLDRAGTGVRGGGEMCVFFCSFAYFCAWLLCGVRVGRGGHWFGFLLSLSLRAQMQVLLVRWRRCLLDSTSFSWLSTVLYHGRSELREGERVRDDLSQMESSLSCDSKLFIVMILNSLCCA